MLGGALVSTGVSWPRQAKPLLLDPFPRCAFWSYVRYSEWAGGPHHSTGQPGTDRRATKFGSTIIRNFRESARGIRFICAIAGHFYR
jgi:hypothetical protein